MILLVARATSEDPPVTTPETIQSKGEDLSSMLAQVADSILTNITQIASVQPMRVTIAVEWVDGSGPTLPKPAPDTKVPSWMS